jgi:superfamily II DNA or RNA helicase
VDPSTKRVNDVLWPHLTYTAKIYQHGNGPNFRTEPMACFVMDHKDRISTSFGFYHRLTRALKAAGYAVVMRDITKSPAEGVYDPQWDRVLGPDSGFDPRFGQDTCLLKIASRPCGRIDCPPGYGKSRLIGEVARLFPRAKIHVVSRRVAVLRDRIWPELAGMLPSVGIVGGGRKEKGRRVMCYTVGSLAHSDGDADFLIGDECHELAADKASELLARYDHSRNFGFSASHDMRLDGKDPRVEAMFGPIIFKVEYDEAAAHGLVVPITVKWRVVSMDTNPCGGIENMAVKKRHGIWRNDFRNAMIAEDARRYGDDVQTLITVETIEHAVHLKKLLPDFQIVHAENGMDPDDRRKYVRWGLIEKNEPQMTVERRRKLTRMFERGRLKKAICNTVWNVGVDFKHLDVLIRADAGGSPINDVQIPGRVARIDPAKECGVIHDYIDLFDRGFHWKSTSREKTYKKQGWEQEKPATSKGKSWDA